MSNASPTAWWGSDLYTKWAGDWSPGEYHHSEAWIYSIAASGIIGLAGVVPLFIIPLNYSKDYAKQSEGSNRMQLLLSFAVGGLLGDVFLHLLPEAWAAAAKVGFHQREAFWRVGLCVLFGIFVFIVVEILASAGEEEQAPAPPQDVNINNNITHKKSSVNNNFNGGVGGPSHSTAKLGKKQSPDEPARKIQVVGYLNLIANSIDNFAHGLAVAGSFMVSYKTGVLTTSAILIHEVPHEIGDFAILLNSGFTRLQAAKAQLYTAFIGLLGALFTLILGSSSVIAGIEMYILGFTAGAFLNISLVSVLPPLLLEESPGRSAAQLIALLLGTYTMATVAC